MKVSESAVQKSILGYLAMRPDVMAWRVNSGLIKIDSCRYVRFGFPGMADILGVTKGGKFLAIEVKSAKGRQSVEQACFEERIEGMGGVYILARSLDDVINGLKIDE